MSLLVKDRDVWTLNPKTWVWKKCQAASGGPGLGTARGVYGHWRYLAEYDVFIGYSNTAGNPWIYKLCQ